MGLLRRHLAGLSIAFLYDAGIFAPQIEECGRTHDIVTCPLTDGDTIEALARGVLDAAPVDQFSLASLSMGGIVAMAVAWLTPDL